MFNEFVSQYGMEILNTVIIAIIGYVGVVIKNIYNKYVNTEIKQSVVKTCVKATEQLYSDIHGEEKLNKCIEYASSILAEKGISVSEIELRMLVESAVKEMNAQIGELVSPAINAETAVG